MCEPVTASIAAGAMIAGVATQVYGTIKGAKAARDGAEEQARIAVRNAQLSEAEAQNSLRAGEKEAAKSRSAGTKIIASQTTGYAASGVDPSSKSAADVAAGTRLVSEADAQTQRANAALEAWGYRTQGLEYGKSAAYAKKRGDQEVLGTILGGVGGVLNTAAGAYGTFRKR